MTELMSSNLVKIIVGVVVVVIVIGGLAMVFGDKIIGFFKGLTDFGEIGLPYFLLN